VIVVLVASKFVSCQAAKLFAIVGTITAAVYIFEKETVKQKMTSLKPKSSPTKGTALPPHRSMYRSGKTPMISRKGDGIRPKRRQPNMESFNMLPTMPNRIDTRPDLQLTDEVLAMDLMPPGLDNYIMPMSTGIEQMAMRRNSKIGKRYQDLAMNSRNHRPDYSSFEADFRDEEAKTWHGEDE